MSHQLIGLQRTLLPYACRYLKEVNGEATSQIGRHTFGVNQILCFVGLVKDLQSIHFTAWKMPFCDSNERHPKYCICRAGHVVNGTFRFKMPCKVHWRLQ